MENKSKIDEQLERMNYLMGYKNPIQEAKTKTNSHLEFCTLGADNKIYGILKECNTYYIKTTEPGNEKLVESYNYINGYNYRNENGYKSYNEATKQLELKLMSLNEAYDKQCNTSTVDFNRGEKTMTMLTESARQELDRIHQIMENANVIGKDNVGDPESKGTATDPTKQGQPFEQNVEASLDKDPKFNGTVEGATEHEKVNNADKKLQNADKMERGKRGDEEYKDTHDDLEGEGVADKKPSGGKVVRVNESMCEMENEFNPDEYAADDAMIAGDDMDAIENDDLVGFDDENEDIDNEFNDDEEEDLDTLLEEFEALTTGSNKVLDGPHGTLDVQATDTIDENKPQVESEDKEALDGPHGSLSVQTMDRLSESIDYLAEAITEKLCNGNECFDDEDEDDDRQTWRKQSYKKRNNGDTMRNTNKSRKNFKQALEECGDSEMSNLQNTIDTMVNEEISRLNIWGKHPRYRKEPMSTPENKEVLRGTADRDWNDDSAKGDAAYGQKIGKGDPFNIIVDTITNSVLSVLKEGKKSKKA